MAIDKDLLTKFSNVYPMKIEEYEQYMPDMSNPSIPEKINQIVQSLARIGRLNNTVVQQWNEVMQWISDGALEEITTRITNEKLDLALNTGLRAIVEVVTSERLEELIESGQFKDIMEETINKIYSEVNETLEWFEAQLGDTVKKSEKGVLTLDMFTERTRAIIMGLESGTINAVLGLGNVHTENTDFIVETAGKNKFNPAKVNLGLYYSPSGGSILSRAESNVNALAGLYPVVEGVSYTISGTSAPSTGGYFGVDATATLNQLQIAPIVYTHSETTLKKFTVPTGQNIKYVAFNVKVDVATQIPVLPLQLETGDVATTFETFALKNAVIKPTISQSDFKGFVKDGGGVSTDMINDEVITPIKTSFFDIKPSKNMIAPLNVNKDFYYSPGSGGIAGRSTATTSVLIGLIPVVQGEWYVVSGTALQSAISGGYFTESATIAGGQSQIQPIVFTSPVDGIGKCFQVPINSAIKYVAFNLLFDTTNKVVSGTYQMEEGEQATEIEPYELRTSLKPEYYSGGSGTAPQPSNALLDFGTWFNFSEGVSYGDESNKISKFRKHWISKDKDLVVAMTGTSLTARSSEHSTLRTDEKERPPLLHSNNFASLLWDKLKWEGQSYRRFDYEGFFAESAGFVSQSNIADWDDGAYRYGLTRYSDAGGSVSFKIPVGAWQYNFIYRSDIKGSQTCQISVAEGDGVVEVFNGTSWVEANMFVFSQRETEKTLSNITVHDAPKAGNDLSIPYESYKIGGNTINQKRLKMRCKGTIMDSRTQEKNVTISTGAGRLLYWGVEWSVREFMLTLINSARGSHSISSGSATALQHYQENELWSFKPDLIFTENPVHNSGGGSASFGSYHSNYWGNVTNNFFFNQSEPISLKTRALANGLTNTEWVIFNSSIAWNFNGINEDGTLKINTDNARRMISALDAQMMTYLWIKENQPQAVSINAVKFWVDSAVKIFGDLRTATEGSGKAGETFTNEGSHWNDTGSRVMAKCILPILDFTI